MRRSLTTVLTLLGLLMLATLAVGGPSRPQAGDLSTLQTRPERTDFKETTRYEEVMTFIEKVVAASPYLQSTTFGYTYEGRPLPVVVFGDVQDASREAVLATGKTRIWVQGNIHAGEVCGKEAMLMLLRSLAQGEHADWRDSLVVMIAPIYNADGNERVRIDNRRAQNGPIGGMGQRANAQGLDLNRDHMKLDSPEARSLALMLQQYDPHIAIDLHTTNGTQHAYHATYAPPLNPNTDAAIDGFLRGDLLPSVTQTLREKHGWHYYYYGNVPGRFGRGMDPGWYTYDSLPRYNTNYIGLRNRIGILSEAYAYATFEERILASLYFVEEIVNYAGANADRVAAVVDEADGHSVVGESLALRAELARSAEPVEILMGATEQLRNPFSGGIMLNRLDVVTPEMMYEYGTFRATEEETAPAAYFIPADLEIVLTKLAQHGVIVTELETDTTLAVERFMITSSTAAEREYQGHVARTLEGMYEAVEVTLPAGTAVVRLDQPLGRLAFYLLEPRSDDGLTTWGFLDRALQEDEEIFPIVRAMSGGF
jgi:hypothetical protein